MEETNDVHIKSGEPEARIAMCKCKEAKGLTYGVRFQRDGSGWKYTWAFKIKENSDKITEEDIKKMILLGKDEGVVEEKEKDYILNIFKFKNLNIN